MATRTGSAVWDGHSKQGKGTMKLGSGAFEGLTHFPRVLKKDRAPIPKS
jgi:hypothetical protein